MKKPASPLPKRSPQISTPKTAKSTPTPTVMSASRSIAKGDSGLSLPRSKNLSAGERKKIIPSSLHMSLSLSPANYESTHPTTTRKSLIMEKMGDKDIVKRAFKTFQKDVNQVRSSGYEISSRAKEVSYSVINIIAHIHVICFQICCYIDGNEVWIVFPVLWILISTSMGRCQPLGRNKSSQLRWLLERRMRGNLESCFPYSGVDSVSLLLSCTYAKLQLLNGIWPT